MPKRIFDNEAFDCTLKRNGRDVTLQFYRWERDDLRTALFCGYNFEELEPLQSAPLNVDSGIKPELSWEGRIGLPGGHMMRDNRLCKETFYTESGARNFYGDVERCLEILEQCLTQKED